MQTRTGLEGREAGAGRRSEREADLGVGMDIGNGGDAIPMILIRIQFGASGARGEIDLKMSIAVMKSADIDDDTRDRTEVLETEVHRQIYHGRERPLHNLRNEVNLTAGKDLVDRRLLLEVILKEHLEIRTVKGAIDRYRQRHHETRHISTIPDKVTNTDPSSHEG